LYDIYLSGGGASDADSGHTSIKPRSVHIAYGAICWCTHVAIRHRTSTQN